MPFCLGWIQFRVPAARVKWSLAHVMSAKRAWIIILAGLHNNGSHQSKPFSSKSFVRYESVRLKKYDLGTVTLRSQSFLEKGTKGWQNPLSKILLVARAPNEPTHVCHHDNPLALFPLHEAVHWPVVLLPNKAVLYNDIVIYKQHSDCFFFFPLLLHSC